MTKEELLLNLKEVRNEIEKKLEEINELTQLKWEIMGEIIKRE